MQEKWQPTLVTHSKNTIVIFPRLCSQRKQIDLIVPIRTHAYTDSRIPCLLPASGDPGNISCLSSLLNLKKRGLRQTRGDSLLKNGASDTFETIHTTNGEPACRAIIRFVRILTTLLVTSPYRFSLVPGAGFLRNCC